MITVEATDAGMRVTIPKDEVPSERVSSFVDWLRLEEVARQSRLSEADANRLAEEIKADWWTKNKDRFIPPAWWWTRTSSFNALAAGRGDLRDRLGPGASVEFFTPRFLFVELFKHKERRARAAKVTEEELLNALHTLVSRLEFVNEANIPLNTWMEAYRLCQGVDEKDTPYVALTIHLDGRLWTHDSELKTALRAKGFDRFFEP